MEKDLAYFMEHPDEFEDLSDEDRMLLANGESIEGEISGAAPDADETTNEDTQEKDDDEPSAASGDATPAPVVVAKDGVHTIPFEELQRARDEARFWQAQAEAAKQAASEKQSGTDAGSPVDLKQLRRDLREATWTEDEKRIEELEAQIDAEVSRRAEIAAIQTLDRQRAEDAQVAERTEIERVAAGLVAKYPALDHTKPETANVEAIAMVQTLSALYAADRPKAKALADAVGRVASLFGMGGDAAAVTNDVAAKADRVIAAASAKAKVPSSMASIPSAPTPPTDELQAISQMSAQQIQDKMMDMPREKILAVLARQM